LTWTRCSSGPAPFKRHIMVRCSWAPCGVLRLAAKFSCCVYHDACPASRSLQAVPSSCSSCAEAYQHQRK
jgi:hypothetical protein